ncbi:MAG: M48 family metallopeptidase [Anaerolineae bacterium]|nr:M48 family metallopeptidase [Anaerolineae bacterium]
MTVSLDPERQERAREYARLRRRLLAIDLAFGLAFLLVWWLSGLTFAVRNAVAGLPRWLGLILYTIAIGGTYFILHAPLEWYSGFVLPHRYGLSTQSLRSWLVDEVKEVLVSAVVLLPLLEVIYLLLRAQPDWWWLWAAIIYLAFAVLLANLAPVVIAPLFYKFVPLSERSDDPQQQQKDRELSDRLVRLAERAGTSVRGVYAFNMSRTTTAANAGLMGLGNTRRIVLGDTLLDNYTADEIETVLAHELGHHVHGDLWKGIGMSTMLTLIGFYLAHVALRWGIAHFGFQGMDDLAAMPWFVLVMSGFALVTMPLQNAWSRWRERMADRYALESTGKPTAFASAMTRLANQNLAEAEPPRWVVWLLYNHPPISERLRMADEYARRRQV